MGVSRSDGRGPDELRPVKITLGVQDFAEGSCLMEMGRTRVLCAASLEEGVPPFMRGRGEGWVTAEYSMLPRATATRSAREVKSGRPGGRTQEIQRLIGRSLRAVVDRAAMGEWTVTVDCDVLVADGGTRTASITGAFVALYEALRGAARLGAMPAVPVHDHVAAISIGVLGGEALLDLDYAEDVAADVDMNIVATGAGRLVEVQGTAEGEAFDRALLDRMLDHALPGIASLIEAQKAVLGI